MRMHKQCVQGRVLGTRLAWALPEAVCPCLSWSGVAMHAFNLSRLCFGLPSCRCCASRSVDMELDSEGSTVLTWTGK